MTTDVREQLAWVDRRMTTRLRDDSSHRRVLEALTDITAAAVYPDRYAHGAYRSSGMLEDPIQTATRVAIDTLIDELEDVLADLSATTLDQFATEQRLADLGIE